MRGSSRFGVFSGLREGVGDEAVLRGGGECADGRRVGRSGDGIEEAHVADVVEINLLFEDNGKSLSVESHGEDGRGEGQFADNGCPL
jgi:hypothetical protein